MKGTKLPGRASFRVINSVLNKYPLKNLTHHISIVNGEKRGCTAFYVNQLTGKHVYVNTDFIMCCIKIPHL